MNLGINASNIKSVGGINHIYNIIYYLRKDYKKKFLINKIIIWCSNIAYQELKNLKNDDIEIKKIKFDNLFYNLYWKFFYLKYLLKKNNCDIFFSLDGIIIGKFKKTVILFQNLIPFNYQEIVNYGITFQTLKNIFTLYLYKFSTLFADGYIVLNNYGKNLIEKKLGKLSNVKVIPHGVSKEYFYIKKKDKKKNNILDIIYISPVDLYKHQWNVIEAIRQLNNQGHKIRLKIIGSISNKQSFKNLSKQMKKTNVKDKIITYYGHLSKKKIFQKMKESDLFLFGSSCESFGLTLLEGMASDLAVLSSNKSGLNYTSGKKAIYFDPLNIESIKNSLLKFINLNETEKIINIKNTKKIAKNYNWRKTSNLTFQFLKKNFFNLEKPKKKKITSKEKLIFKNYKYNYLENLFIYSYSINFFTPIAIFFLLYLNGFKEIAVQYGIVLSIGSFFTQIFSANARNLIIADKYKNIFNFIYFRSILSLFILLFASYFINKFYDFNLIVLVSSLLLVVLTWIKEIFIAEAENSKKIKIEFISQLYYLISFSLFLIFYLLENDYRYLFFFPIFILIELSYRVISTNKIKFFKVNNLNFIKDKFRLNLNVAFWSGFYLTLLNLVIRILIDFNYSPNIAADYFFCFSLATFPGTIVTSIIGVSYLRNEKQFPIYFKFLIFLYSFGLLLSIFFPYNYFQFNTKLAIFTICSSGIIAIVAQSIRQLNIIDLNKRDNTFKRDILFFFLSILLLIIFLNNFKEFFILYILCITFLSLFIYLKYHDPLKNYK